MANVLLSAKGIKIRFGGVVAADGIDLDVYEDENLAIAEGKRPTFIRVASTSFLVILVAEFGDLTQIATATLAARYHGDVVSVAIGATLALWAVGGLAIAGGRGLLKLIPLVWISRIAGAIMLVIAGVSLAAALA